MSNLMSDYALELSIDEVLLYTETVEDIKSELYGEDYADAMLAELGMTAEQAMFGEF